MSFREMTADNGEPENLSKWLGLLARFNKGRPLPKEMTKRIEGFFEYYWSRDKHYALKRDDDKKFLKELPLKIRIDVRYLFMNLTLQIYKDFLY